MQKLCSLAHASTIFVTNFNRNCSGCQKISKSSHETSECPFYGDSDLALIKIESILVVTDSRTDNGGYHASAINVGCVPDLMIGQRKRFA